MKLTECKECWRVTWIGWMGLLALGGLVLFLFLFTIHPFLAPTKPVDADILIADNCLVDYGLKKLSDEFRSKNYSLILSAGVQLPQGSPLAAENKTSGELSAAILKKFGIREKAIVPIIPKPVKRDRTFASALAVKKWLAQNNIQPKGINVFSFGPHSRRSWMLFKEAIGEEIPVGIIACEYREYDPKKWWITRSGVPIVLNETIAYIYAKLVFDPERVRAEIANE
ncbi:YdcF family protein [Thermodesulfobacteriota bacterium]